MEIEDNYLHLDENVMYVLERIPGSTRDDVERLQIETDMNSQIIAHCSCKEICKMNECSCLVNSGGENYTKEPKLLFNFSNITYPVFECNSLCSCPSHCGNRIVQFGPSKHLIIKEVVQKGFGLFSTTFIPKGAFICEYAGEVISQNEALQRHQENMDEGNMNYIFCLNEHSAGNITQTIIDPSHFGNIGRYINHSCEPNCLIIPVRIDSPVPKLAIVTRRDIPSNEEITFDYGSHQISPEDKTKISSGNEMNNKRIKCFCNGKNCRGWLPFASY